MANYIINECLTNDEFIISASTLTLGQSIRFGVGENLFCGTVGEETESPTTPSYYFDAEYTDCCECLEGDGRESLNFSFIRCGTEEEINIEAATNFCSEYGVPTTGLTYEIQFGSETPFCATFEGLSELGVTNYHYSSGPFSLCEDCGEEPPRSANTLVTICVEICTTGETGTSVVSVNPPHPIYTDGYGTPVTQLNMVTLGGPNGLNN